MFFFFWSLIPNIALNFWSDDFEIYEGKMKKWTWQTIETWLLYILLFPNIDSDFDQAPMSQSMQKIGYIYLILNVGQTIGIALFWVSNSECRIIRKIKENKSYFIQVDL